MVVVAPGMSHRPKNAAAISSTAAIPPPPDFHCPCSVRITMSHDELWVNDQCQHNPPRPRRQLDLNNTLRASRSPGPPQLTVANPGRAVRADATGG
jgi:hypothetical protein